MEAETQSFPLDREGNSWLGQLCSKSGEKMIFLSLSTQVFSHYQISRAKVGYRASQVTWPTVGLG
jgi:hypothetical protein